MHNSQASRTDRPLRVRAGLDCRVVTVRGAKVQAGLEGRWATRGQMLEIRGPKLGEGQHSVAEWLARKGLLRLHFCLVTKSCPIL